MRIHICVYGYRPTHYTAFLIYLQTDSSPISPFFFHLSPIPSLSLHDQHQIHPSSQILPLSQPNPVFLNPSPSTHFISSSISPCFYLSTPPSAFTTLRVDNFLNPTEVEILHLPTHVMCSSFKGRRGERSGRCEGRFRVRRWIDGTVTQG